MKNKKPVLYSEIKVECYTFEEWVKKFKPVRNPVRKTDMYAGCWLDSEEEIQWAGRYNEAAGGNRCWTLVDGEGENCWIIEGWHYINVLGGYFVTEKPFKDGVQYQIEG